MRKFEHIEAENFEDLLNILYELKSEAKINAGGTDLLSLFKDEYLFSYPRFLVDAKKVEELNYVEFRDGVLKIGSLTRLKTVLSHPLIKQKFPLLTEATLTIASPQIRNMATVGGNLCQDIRCWYYRYPARLGGPLSCKRKGGKICLAIKGDNRYHAIVGKGCYAVCPSDLAVAFSCLNAKLVIAKKGGERKVDVESLYTPNGLALTEEEIVKEVEIPFWESTNQRFIKYTLRRPIDFAIVSVACSFRLEGKRIKKCSISLGGVSFRPEKAKEIEDLLENSALDEKVVDEAKKMVLPHSKPLKKNGYKVEILRAIIGRILLSLM